MSVKAHVYACHTGAYQLNIISACAKRVWPDMVLHSPGVCMVSNGLARQDQSHMIALAPHLYSTNYVIFYVPVPRPIRSYHRYTNSGYHRYTNSGYRISISMVVPVAVHLYYYYVTSSLFRFAGINKIAYLCWNPLIDCISRRD